MTPAMQQQIKLCITNAFWNGVVTKGDKDDKEGACEACIATSLRILETQEEIEKITANLCRKANDA